VSGVLNGLARVGLATAAACAVLVQIGLGQALLPGGEAVVSALAAEMLPAMATWSLAWAGSLVAFRALGPLRPETLQTWSSWLALSTVQLVIDVAISPSGAGLAAVARVQALGCAIAVIAAVGAGRIARRPPPLDHGATFWLATAIVPVVALAGWGEGPGDTRINLPTPVGEAQLLEWLPFGLGLATVSMVSASREGLVGWRAWSGYVIVTATLLGLVAERLDDRGSALLAAATLGMLAVALAERGLRLPAPVMGLLACTTVYLAARELQSSIVGNMAVRFAAYLDPYGNGLPRGDQLGHAHLLGEAAGLTGLGVGAIDAGDVAAAHTDFAAAMLVGAWGSIGLAAWLVLAWGLPRGLARAAALDARALPTARQGLLALAAGIGAKLVASLWGVFGVAPHTGLVTPFLSHSDSASYCLAAVVGLALGLLDTPPRGRVVNRALPPARATMLLATLLLPVAIATTWRATASLRGAAHAGLWTTDDDNELRFHPSRVATRLSAPTRATWIDGDGDLWATTVPSGLRVAVADPALAEAVGHPGDTIGTLEADLNTVRVPWRPGEPRPTAPSRVTTLDRSLSRALVPLLQARLDEVPVASAAILVLRDHAGAVLAEIVLRRPGLAGARYADATNLAAQFDAPPGSQNKPLTLAAGDAEGLPRDALYNCPKDAAGRGRARACHGGGCEIIRDFPRGRHAELLTAEVLTEVSCNAATVDSALQQSGGQLSSLIAAVTGDEPLDLSNAQRRAEAAIGQGPVAMTARDVSAMYLALSTSGVMYRCTPTTPREACTGEQLVSPDTAAWTRSLLARPVAGDDGTARAARLPLPLQVVAKSGTAQESWRDDDPSDLDHAWLSGAINDQHGHVVAFTFLLVRTDVTGGSWARSVPGLADALLSEGYLVGTIAEGAGAANEPAGPSPSRLAAMAGETDSLPAKRSAW